MNRTSRGLACAPAILAICVAVACGDSGDGGTWTDGPGGQGDSGQGEGGQGEGGQGDSGQGDSGQGDSGRGNTEQNPGGQSSGGVRPSPSTSPEPKPGGGFGQPTTTNNVRIGASFAGSVDFGRVRVGGKRTEQFAAINNTLGGATVVVKSVEASGDQFSIGADKCAGVSLAFRASCSFSVTFKPDRQGRIDGSVKVFVVGQKTAHLSTVVGVGVVKPTLPTKPALPTAPSDAGIATR